VCLSLTNRRRCRNSIAGRRWVHQGGQGGRQWLLDGFGDAVEAIPASLKLSAAP
jgi:hypothetical protein